MDTPDAPETAEHQILIEHAIAADQSLPWSQRRAAFFRAAKAVREFNEWANTRLFSICEDVGFCPCCPNPRPINNGSCLMMYFRTACTVTRGEWDGTEDWELSPPHHQRAEWYASQLSLEEAARFWRAIRGADRITADDYNRIARTIQTLIEAGGWKSVIPSA